MRSRTKSKGALHGTPAYMAPEVITRQQYGKAVDSWAFGCMLAHMGARAPPFAAALDEAAGDEGMLMDLFEQIGEGQLSPLDGLTEDTALAMGNCPPPLLALARQCVLIAPAARPEFNTIAAVLSEPSLLHVVRPTGGRARPEGLLRRRTTGKPAVGPKTSTFRSAFRQKAGGSGATPASPRGALVSPRAASPTLDALAGEEDTLDKPLYI